MKKNTCLSMIVNLFPTSIYKAEMPEYTNWVEKRWTEHRFNTDESLTGEMEGQVLVHHDSYLTSFFVELNEHVKEYLETFLVDYDIHFMKTWYSVTDEKRSVPHHNHDPAHISWVYYVSGEDPLCFAKENFNEWFPEAFAGKEKNFNNGTVYQMNVKPGDLLIFPSKLFHHTYNTMPRVSLAGDILLTNKNLNTEGGLLHPKYWKQF